MVRDGQESCSVPVWNDRCTKDVNCTTYVEVEKSVLSETRPELLNYRSIYAHLHAVKKVCKGDKVSLFWGCEFASSMAFAEFSVLKILLVLYLF